MENSLGSLVLNDSGHTITINGAGQTLAILQMQNEGPVTNRVLEVDAGTTAVILGVTVEDGVQTGASATLAAEAASSTTGRSTSRTRP